MNYYRNIRKFISKNQTEVILISLIIALALVLRLYKIGEYLAFLGDEGRDVRVIRNILKGNLAFIGPQTSVGNMYLGPLYYYLMAPALFFSRLDPIGPAIFVALLGTLAIGLVWWAGRSWFNPLSGLIAALLLTISPVAIIYSRSSWNPNPMPLFALISIFSLYQVWHNKKYHYLLYASISLAFALQMHYLGLLLIPTLAVFWFLSLKTVWPDKNKRRYFLDSSLKSLVIFLFFLSPLILFDLRHHGMNFNAFRVFFSGQQAVTNLSPVDFSRSASVWGQVISDLLLGRSQTNAPLLSSTVFILSIWVFLKQKKKSAAIILFIWIGFSVLGLSTYRQPIYSHYFGFFWPAVYLLLGWIISRLLQDTYLHKLLGLLLFFWLVIVSIDRSPLRQAPNRQLQRTKEIVDLIIKQSRGKPFNFGLIAKQNYDESYRYFLENKKAKLIRGEDGVTDQLFVVCEDQNCQAEGNPQWQIAIFGPATTVDKWKIDYIKIFKLVHAN